MKNAWSAIPPGGVRSAGVDAVAVPGQRQALLAVSAGLVVGGVHGVQPRGHEVELIREAVLLLFEQVQVERSGVVGLEAGAALVLDAVFLDGKLVAFGLGGGVQAGELRVEHRLADLGRYLDGPVVVGDELLDLVHEDRGISNEVVVAFV